MIGELTIINIHERVSLPLDKVRIK